MAEKLRVLHLLLHLGFAGLGANFSPFFKFANRRFFDVTIGVFFEADIRRVKILERDGTKVEVFHGDLKRFNEFMRRGDIDIIHFSRAGMEGSRLLREKAPIKLEFNIFGLHDTTPENALIDRHLLHSKTTALRYLTHAKLTMEEFLDKGRVQYLPLDIEEFDKFLPTAQDRDRLKSQLDIDYDSQILCRVGRADLWKWSFFTLHAFSLTVRKFPKVVFLLVGGASAEVISKIKKWGLSKHFRILPEVSDEQVIQVLHSCDIIAHSSHIGESFSGAIVQSMAARKPVVVNATDWADNGQVEQVDHRITGIIANTPRTYSDALVYLLKNREVRERMGRNAYSKARTLYVAPKVVASLEKSYSDLAELKSIKPDQERTAYYQSREYIPAIEEIRNWPSEYNQRLVESGYRLGPVGKFIVRSAWMATNMMPFLRQTRFPAAILRSNGILSYLPAVT